MSQTVITSAFEQLKAQEAANGGIVVLDEFVFANVPDLDISSPIDRSEGLPDAAQIVHRQAVDKTGMVNNNAVVYSVVMGADVGDFEFNWVGLVNKANQVVAMIVHAPTQKKIRTASGKQGNVLTRSFLMEYNGASEQTQIVTPADTWQIDFTARLNGVDERTRRENCDIYHEASFLEDGFKVEKAGAKYNVRKGVGYVAGLRAELLFDQEITVAELPVKVWVDVCWNGTLISVWDTSVKILTGQAFDNRQDGDEWHFVFAVAEIQADGSVIDLRPLNHVSELGKIDGKERHLLWIDGDKKLSQTGVSEFTRGMLQCDEAEDVLKVIKLKTPEGGANVLLSDGNTLQNAVDGGERGFPMPSYEKNRDISGNMLDGSVALDGKKYQMPGGSFSAYNWFRNRSSSVLKGVADFSLKGQGSKGTIISQSLNLQDANGAHMFIDNFIRFQIGGVSLINDALGGGVSSADSKNGQVWARYSEDGEFDDMFLSGGDALSFCLGTCKNITVKGLKIDYQYRFPGYGKSPLIVGDYSEKCRFIDGYVKAVGRNGTIYQGDLADNDQADDTVMAFINLMGLPYATKANQNACLWQEGENRRSNMRAIGLNLSGNGIGHGITELAMGTNIGSVYREHQVRAVWNRNRFVSIGGQFLDNTGQYGDNWVRGAIHADNAETTISVGNMFDGNFRDFIDYTGATTKKTGSVMQSVADEVNSVAYINDSNAAIHHGFSGGKIGEQGQIFDSGGNGNHVVLTNELIVGNLGQFNTPRINGKQIDVIGCTAVAPEGYAGNFLTQGGMANITLTQCSIKNYGNGLGVYAYANRVVYRECTFYKVTFSDQDLTSAIFLNCRFVECVNSPEGKGYNFLASGSNRPDALAVNVTLPAGGSYKLPAWAIEGRGVYDVKVGGHGENLNYWKGYIAKKSAASSTGATVIVESEAGAISVSWPSDDTITVSAKYAGSYRISVA